MLLLALVFYLKYEAPPNEQNFSMVMEMLRAGDVREDDDSYQSPLDELYDRLEMRSPDHIAVKYYRDYRSGSGKTLKSIQITLAAKLEKFNLESLAALTVTDELDLMSLGEKKTALFIIIPDNDGSFNFLVSILYTQLFQQLFYGLELMMALFRIVQGLIARIMTSAGFTGAGDTVLPESIKTAINNTGFLDSIPLWAVTLLGGLFITVLSFIMIMSVYGRFFKLYMYSAIAPVPLASFAGEPSQSMGKSFIKSYAAVCLEGAIVVLACIIFSLFASAPPAIDPNTAAVTQVWAYVGELIFNMLVLVGAVKMADRLVREMLGL